MRQDIHWVGHRVLLFHVGYAAMRVELLPWQEHYVKAAEDGEDCEWPLCLQHVGGQRQRLVFESTVNI